jgi:signal transduction histidine kinase
MFSVPDRSLFLPFHSRVAQWMALAILVTTLSLLLLLRLGFRQVMFEQLDAALQHDARMLISKYHKSPANLSRLANEFEQYIPASQTTSPFAALLNAHGEVVFTTQAAPNPVPKVSHTAVGVAVSHGRYRLLEIPVEKNAPAPHAILVGASLDSFQQSQQAYDRYAFLALLVVGLVALITVVRCATKAVDPLNQFVHRVERLQANIPKLRLSRSGALDEMDRISKLINQLLERISLDEFENRHLLADAAHQLRTPLAAIRSSVEVALAGNQDPAVYQELLAQVVDETESLEALVNQLLLLSETEMPPTTQFRERVAFDQLVQRSVEMFEPVAESRGVAIWVGTLARAEIKGNRHHLRQVINNLLENAVKFTAVKPASERRQVTVELTTDPEMQQTVLRVSDTGIGVGPEHLHRVFDRFYRADSARTREQGANGNGLGLSIVKAVAESHGGTARIESTFGIGTTILVQLPLISSKSERTVAEHETV